MFYKHETEVDNFIISENTFIDSSKHNIKFQPEKTSRFEELKKYLLKGKKIFPITSESTKKYETSELYVHFNELNKYIDSVNEFIKLVNDKNLDYNFNIKKLQNYMKTIDVDCKNSILENQKLLIKFKEREMYWNNRITKLRAKCIQKNKDFHKLQNNFKILLNILYFNFMFLCFLIFMIYSFGITKLIEYTIFYGFYIFDFLYLGFTNYLKIFNYIYKFIFNNYLLILILVFGFIGLRYFKIKKKLIISALIFLVSVGNFKF